MEDNILVDNINIDTFVFSSKPKKSKNGDLMTCKIKRNKDDALLIQFPKMKVLNYTNDDKHIELEFINDKGYNKKVHVFLSKLDEHIIQNISDKSEHWFGKKIPIEKIQSMYNKFVKENENGNSIHLLINKCKILKKDEEVSKSEINKGDILECIAQLKYLVFTKDTCFINWEMYTAKIHKKITRVSNFGFVDDPNDNSDNECLDEEEIITFF